MENEENYRDLHQKNQGVLKKNKSPTKVQTGGGCIRKLPCWTEFLFFSGQEHPSNSFSSPVIFEQRTQCGQLSIFSGQVDKEGFWMWQNWMWLKKMPFHTHQVDQIHQMNLATNYSKFQLTFQRKIANQLYKVGPVTSYKWGETTPISRAISSQWNPFIFGHL